MRIDRRGNERRTAVPEARAAAIANTQLPPPDLPAVAKQQSSLAAHAAHVHVDDQLDDQPASFRTSTGIFRDNSTRTASIGGPSFLGLSDDSQDQGEYLLEDEGSSGGVLRKLVLLAILAAVGGLVFIQWRSNTGFFANPELPKPPKIASPPLPVPQPDHQVSGEAASHDSSPPADSAKRPSPDPLEKKSDSKPDATVADGEDHAVSRSHAKHKTTEDASADRSPSPALVRAQDFLLGKNGVKQNCEQGLVYLRAATKANEPAAALQMGALYASGHCVTRDRLMAYRWFNSAHELQPDNPEIKSDIEQLWGQMTAQERRQARR
jgi:TPR repeat protein